MNPYLSGDYAPVTEEVEPIELRLISGEVPRDVAGVYLRNGPNPRFAPEGRYHWFDGDGFVHAATIEDGEVRYTGRFVRSAAFEAETRSGRPLWKGIMERPDGNFDGFYKATANTDVISFAGRLWALWYASGDPVRLEPNTYRSLETETLGGGVKISAHAKVDPKTGELFFFEWRKEAPFVRYGRLSSAGVLDKTWGLELAGPRQPHDLAFTDRFLIGMDLPLFYDAAALAAGRWVIRYHPELPARFALMGRETSELRWFEAESCFVYHVINAYEEANEVVLTGFRVTNPLPTPKESDGRLGNMMASLRLDARLHEWRFDLVTGATRERRLGDTNAEFPTVNRAFLGSKNRFGYAMSLDVESTLRFSGITKFDLVTNSSERLSFGSGRSGSEAPFAPRLGAVAEDDGYLFSFVHESGAQSSELWIVDAQRVSEGPVARLAIPARVPLGFHSTFVSASETGGSR